MLYSKCKNLCYKWYINWWDTNYLDHLLFPCCTIKWNSWNHPEPERTSTTHSSAPKSHGFKLKHNISCLKVITLPLLHNNYTQKLHTAQARASHPVMDQVSVYIFLSDSELQNKNKTYTRETHHGQKVLPMDLRNLSALLACHQQHQKSDMFLGKMPRIKETIEKALEKHNEWNNTQS